MPGCVIFASRKPGRPCLNFRTAACLRHASPNNVYFALDIHYFRYSGMLRHERYL